MIAARKSTAKKPTFFAREDLAYYRQRRRDDGSLVVSWGVYLDGRRLEYEGVDGRGTIEAEVTHLQRVLTPLEVSRLEAELLSHENSHRLDIVQPVRDNENEQEQSNVI